MGDRQVFKVVQVAQRNSSGLPNNVFYRKKTIMLAFLSKILVLYFMFFIFSTTCLWKSVFNSNILFQNDTSQIYIKLLGVQFIIIELPIKEDQCPCFLSIQAAEKIIIGKFFEIKTIFEELFVYLRAKCFWTRVFTLGFRTWQSCNSYKVLNSWAIFDGTLYLNGLRICKNVALTGFEAAPSNYLREFYLLLSITYLLLF